MSALLTTTLVSAALLPPLSLATLLGSGLILHRRRPHLAVPLLKQANVKQIVLISHA